MKGMWEKKIPDFSRSLNCAAPKHLSKFALARGGDEAWAASGCWEKSQDFLHPSKMILGKYLSHSAAMGYKTAQG